MLVFNKLCLFVFILPVENSEESDEEITNQDTDKDYVSCQEPELISSNQSNYLSINLSIHSEVAFLTSVAPDLCF